jgi:hypothetical protein
MGEEDGDPRRQDSFRVVHMGHLSAHSLVGTLGCKGMGISNDPRHPRKVRERPTDPWVGARCRSGWPGFGRLHRCLVAIRPASDGSLGARRTSTSGSPRGPSESSLHATHASPRLPRRY